MAKIDSSDNHQPNDWKPLFWSASHLLTLGVVTRFFRNFNRYNQKNPEQPPKEELLNICYRLEHKVYAYNTLNSASTGNHSAAEVTSTTVLHQQIHHLFDHLHHQLLCYEADQIVDIIPVIDQQLNTWSLEENKTEITNQELVKSAEDLARIEVFIQDQVGDS